MPVGVELNGLLPGRGPGRWLPPGRGPGRGLPPGRWPPWPPWPPGWPPRPPCGTCGTCGTGRGADGRGALPPPCGAMLPPCGALLPPCGAALPPCGALLPPCGAAVPPCGAAVSSGPSGRDEPGACGTGRGAGRAGAAGATGVVAARGGSGWPPGAASPADGAAGATAAGDAEAAAAGCGAPGRIPPRLPCPLPGCPLPARRAAWPRGARRGGAATGTPGALSLLAPFGAESFLEPAHDRRLDRRGRRTYELTHFLELDHHGLALNTELFREFVNPDLRHYAPLPGPDSRTFCTRTFPPVRGRACSGLTSACGVHRLVLIERSSLSRPAFPTGCRSCLSLCPVRRDTANRRT